MRKNRAIGCLQTIREYAVERLALRGEEGALRRQHALLYLALAKGAEAELQGAAQLMWMNRLEVEHDNLRAALNWLMQHEEHELALRMAAAL